MDYQVFSDQLEQLDIKKTEFMRYVGMGQSTISTWSRAGKVPRWVEAHLDLMLKAKAMLPDLTQYKAGAHDSEG